MFYIFGTNFPKHRRYKAQTVQSTDGSRSIRPRIRTEVTQNGPGWLPNIQSTIELTESNRHHPEASKLVTKRPMNQSPSAMIRLHLICSILSERCPFTSLPPGLPLDNSGQWFDNETRFQPQSWFASGTNVGMSFESLLAVPSVEFGSEWRVLLQSWLWSR